MATAYEGEAIVGTAQIDYQSNTSVALYTVPAGRYAKIKINKLKHVAGGATTLAIAGTQNYSIPIAIGLDLEHINDLGFTEELILYSGDTISTTSGGGPTVEVRASILEFANP